MTEALMAILQRDLRPDMTQAELDTAATNVMKVPRMDSAPSIAQRWIEDGVSGVKTKAYVDNFYFIRKGISWPVFSSPGQRVLPPAHAVSSEELGFNLITDNGVALVRRGPENARDEDTSRDEYTEGMPHWGLNNDGRSPMIVMRAQPNERWVESEWCAWAYASATVTESWYIAKQRWPDNELINVTVYIGFTNVIEIVECCPSDVLLWLVREWNRWQVSFLGSFFCEFLEPMNSLESLCVPWIS